MSPIKWAVELLRNFDATRHNWRAQYVGEEPQITDFARGEEMTVSAELSGFSEAEQFEIRQLLTA